MQFVFLVLTLFLLSGCSTKFVQKHKLPSRPHSTSQQPTYKLKSDSSIKVALYNEYRKWDKTPYRLGGNSFSGVDCSSLVQSIYKDSLGVSVPRTTRDQAKVGYWVAKNQLKEGDLLLFKTGYNVRHSGIYLENGNFINASTKHGVTISSIHNPYWKSKYWQSRRVIP